MGWFLSLLVVGLSFGLGVVVGWFLWGSRPDPRVPLQARGPVDQVLTPVEPADAARPIDDLIADLIATPESITVDISDTAISGADRSANGSGGRSDTAETTLIRQTLAATATIPAVRAEPATEVIPAARPTEVIPAAQVTEVLPAVETAQVETAQVETAQVEEAETDPSPEPTEDLRRIEGIGPKLATALTAAGITRYAQLAESDPAALGATLRAQGIRFAPNLDTWIAQAKLLADGDEEGFTKLAAELVANRRARARR